MTIIAMTREMGTLGKDVAAGLADSLGIEVVHQELVEHYVAERLELGESTVHRFLEGQSPLWERWKIDSKRMSRYTAEEILQLANKGNVLIRGWGAAQLLRDVSHVLCVRICAPMPKRTVVMMERIGVTDEHAMRLEIEHNDNAHSQLIQRQFGGDRRDPEDYDIVLNTGFVPVGTCIKLIEQLARSPIYRETQQSRSVLADKVIKAAVETVLHSHLSGTLYGSGIHVTVEGGKVILAGIVNGSGNIDAGVRIIERIDGVSEVENNVAFVPVNSGV